jgi:transcriptional regulator with XRE-family HTH domain
MPIRESRADRGRQLADRIAATIGRELREARLSAGLSQSAVGRAASMSHTQVGRIENATFNGLRVDQLCRLASALGLDLSVRTFPSGDPIRDRAHLALLERLRVRVAPTWRWQTEVPLPIAGDRRAWDALMTIAGSTIAGSTIAGSTIGVEAETVIHDDQAMERRLALKRRDGHVDHVVLLVAETTRNRVALAAVGPGLRDAFPVEARAMLQALRDGRDPGGSGIVIL